MLDGMFVVSCITHVGKTRSSNEDNCCLSSFYLPEAHGSMDQAFETILPNHSIAGVFDGLGGEWFGEVASFMAAKVFSAEAIHTAEDLARLFNDANAQIVNEALIRKAPIMGTTCAMVAPTDDGLLFGNVGDSQILMLRDGEVEPLARMDTNRELLNSMGLYEATPSITQYLGMRENARALQPHIRQLRPENSDLFLLSSDGLTNEVELGEIKEVLRDSNANIRRKVERLCEMALQKGGNDNVTIVLCEAVMGNEQNTEGDEGACDG